MKKSGVTRHVRRVSRHVRSKSAPKSVDPCEIYTIVGLAARLGVGEQVIRRLIRVKKLSAGKMGRSWMISGSAVHKMLGSSIVISRQ